MTKKRVDIKAILKDPKKRKRLTKAGNLRQVDAGRYIVSAPDKLTKPEAIAVFKDLVARYGLKWTAQVPAEAYTQMARVNEVLDESDRREALGLRK